MHAIDKTVTAAGGRLLATRLSNPMTDRIGIIARQDAVDFFMHQDQLASDLQTTLKQAPDMARALGRLSLGRGGPRDLKALRQGLEAGFGLYAQVSKEAISALPAHLDEAFALFAGAAALLLLSRRNRVIWRNSKTCSNPLYPKICPVSA